MRPLKGWPIWMLQAVVALRKRKTMWTDCYIELVERGNDAAIAYAKKRQAWVCVAPKGLQ